MKYLEVILLSLLQSCNGLDNGLALTPPMGWMTWQRYRCFVNCDEYPDDCISDWNIRAQAERMVTDGYLSAGYNYLIIDDCWSSKERDASGRLVPDPMRFPYGMKDLASYINFLGLKFGIYATYGRYTCMGYPGSMGHLEEDAATFADWGVEYVKFDACYTNYNALEVGYIEFGKQLNKTGRPIVYSCSMPAYQEPYGKKSNYSLLIEHCNLWRNYRDIEDVFENVTTIMQWFDDNHERLKPYHGPGHWHDPDMLIIGNYGLSYEQAKVQMAIWAILSAPLLMSADLKMMDPKFKDILLNKDAIAINQDKFGRLGKIVIKTKKVNVWLKPVEPVVDGSISFALAFVNIGIGGPPYKFVIPLKKLGLHHPNGYIVKDVFNKTTYPETFSPEDSFTVRIAPSGAVLLKATPRSYRDL